MKKNPQISVKKLGMIQYKEAWEMQEMLFNGIVDQKLKNKELPEEEQLITDNYLLLCEHPHVYTLGKSGTAQNLLIDQIQLKAKDATFYHINRGGDITYHGPGQLVAYPILNLEYYVDGVKEYIHKLEEVVIRLLRHYDIRGERLDNAIGVWLDKDVQGKTRKVCAIGVRSSRWVSMHGLALNVNTNLDYFNYINPCGFVDKGVTSIAKETGKEIPFKTIEQQFIDSFFEVFSQ